MTFSAIAPRVTQRLLVRRWLGLLRRQLGWAVAALAACIMLQLVYGVAAWVPLTLVALWLAGAAVHAWIHRPDSYESLAHWDKVRGRSEAFAAAWWCEHQKQPTPLQQKHLQAELTQLGAAVPSLTKDLPLGIDWRLLLPAILAVLPLIIQLARTERPVPMDEAARAAIAEEADRLAAKDWQQNQIKGLTEEEKKALAELQQRLKSTAADLQDKSSKASARDVLSALDKNASAAEALAQRLGAEMQDWASAGLIAGLQAHTDTADLADATAAKKSAELSKAAMTLAAQLRQPGLAPETLQRLASSFADAAKKAEAADKERMVGKPVLAAAEELAASHADQAAQQLESLAMQMNDLAQREAAQKELQKLAQQLRDAGSRGAEKDGEGKSGGMTQMKGAGQQGQAANAGQSAKVNQTPPGAANQAQNNLQPPGLGRSQSSGTMQQGSMSKAEPGQQQTLGQMNGARLQKSDSQQPTNPNRPRLIAPVPGKPGNQQPNMLMVMPNQPPPPGGAGAMIPQSGRDPGTGTADLNAAATAQQKAAQSAVVNASPAGEGNSSTRSVEGQDTKNENAQRSSTQETLQQIQREEAALDDLPLPPARREHVRRYFNELRKRFEQ